MEQKQSILVNSNILLDTDWSVCCYLYANFQGSEYIDWDFFKLSEYGVRANLIYRKDINPLTLFFSDDCDEIYKEIIETKTDDILEFTRPYDIFPLLVTLREQGKFNIIISCDNDTVKQYIDSLNTGFDSVIGEYDLSKYNVLFTKYINDVPLYQNVSEKHIYVANARYNYDDQVNALSTPVLKIFSDTNIFHTMDLYTDIHFTIREEENGTTQQRNNEEDSDGDST